MTNRQGGFKRLVHDFNVWDSTFGPRPQRLDVNVCNPTYGPRLEGLGFNFGILRFESNDWYTTAECGIQRLGHDFNVCN